MTHIQFQNIIITLVDQSEYTWRILGTMEDFCIRAQSVNKNIVIASAHVRISLLTSRLLRVEKGCLTDLPTQTVLFRDLGIVPFSTEYRGNLCIIRTDHVVFQVNFKTGKVLGIELSDGKIVSNFRTGNLRGTARTLEWQTVRSNWNPVFYRAVVQA